MNELQEICATMLDNADLNLSVDGLEGSIKLEFSPAGYTDTIIFYCSNYSRLNYRKSADDEDSIFVGETQVTIIEKISSVARLYKEDGWEAYNQEFMKPVVKIDIEGGAMLSIVCENFSWRKGNGKVNIVL